MARFRRVDIHVHMIQIIKYILTIVEYILHHLSEPNNEHSPSQVSQAQHYSPIVRYKTLAIKLKILSMNSLTFSRVKSFVDYRT